MASGTRRNLISPMHAIVIDRLSKWYGSRQAVCDLSLEVCAGSIFGFLGPNGSGKTTTIRVLMGLLKPTAGAAFILDQDCTSVESVRSQVGYLPGDLRIYPWLTAAKALSIFSRARGKDLLAEGRRLCASLSLDPALPASRMSRGTRQKLGLVLALAHQPEVLILDEPTNSLDPIVQAVVYSELRRQAASGRTVFLSSHTLSEVADLCDHVAILREGHLVAHETLTELRRSAPRQVNLVFRRDSVPSAAPAFLTVLERSSNSWRCTLRGDSSELIAWCAQQHLEDLSVCPPDLPSLFQRFYEQGSKPA